MLQLCYIYLCIPEKGEFCEIRRLAAVKGITGQKIFYIVCPNLSELSIPHHPAVENIRRSKQRNQGTDHFRRISEALPVAFSTRRMPAELRQIEIPKLPQILAAAVSTGIGVAVTRVYEEIIDPSSAGKAVFRIYLLTHEGIKRTSRRKYSYATPEFGDRVKEGFEQQRFFHCRVMSDTGSICRSIYGR